MGALLYCKLVFNTAKGVFVFLVTVNFQGGMMF